ncbi:LPS translocon maturation chaperone LptM [Stenotrophomonas tumulicola]|uniref:Lipoprotein n=1 Tax=Stenotrophomonas tumulicola TaxID=1685415 RepID=A0A7W3IH23_9GAMM|nr:lipoprotein [Stenotrophomonas tumulicola]MBA8681545.1 lipoprotein [Stenotrophomonas tumulicola]
MKNFRRNLILIPLAASALLFLGACGNKGPLVMPQTPVPVEEVVEPAEPATDNHQQENDVPPAVQGTDAGNPASVPDPVTPQVDDGAGDGDE